MAGHWTPPPLHGTSAADDVRTFFARAATERERVRALDQAARRPPRTPLVSARTVAPPPYVRPFADRTVAYGWDVRCTYAYGWPSDKDGFEKTTNIMEPTGELTETGRPETRKIGVRESDPVHSHLLKATIPDRPEMLAAAYWKNEEWHYGIVRDASGMRLVTGRREWIKWVEDNGPGSPHLF